MSVCSKARRLLCLVLVSLLGGPIFSQGFIGVDWKRDEGLYPTWMTTTLNENWMAYVADQKTVHIYNLRSNRLTQTLQTAGDTSAVALSLSGQFLGSFGRFHSSIWDVSLATKLYDLPETGQIFFLPDGLSFFQVVYEVGIERRRSEDGTLLQSFPVMEGNPCVSPDGSLIAILNYNGVFALYRTGDGAEVWKGVVPYLDAIGQNIYGSPDISPDNRWICLPGYENCYVYSLETHLASSVFPISGAT